LKELKASIVTRCEQLYEVDHALFMVKECPKLTGIEKVADKLFNSQQAPAPEIEHQKTTTLVPSAAEKGIQS